MDRINKLLHGLLVRAWTLIIITFAGILPAKVITVSPDGPTTSIQSAVEAADSGDEIIVEPGHYFENIVITQDLILRSSDPLDWDVVAKTIIDANHDDTVVMIAPDITSQTLLSGFTITGGYVDHTYAFPGRAAGIEGFGSSLTIERNIIRDNETSGIIVTFQFGAPEYRGGLAGGIGNSHGLIQYNKINNNISGERGGGFRRCNGVIQYKEIMNNQGSGGYLSEGTVRGNLIHNNQASSGGGLLSCSGIVEDNVITSNTAKSSGGGISTCHGIIRNNIIAHNSALKGSSGGGGRRCDALIYNNLIYENFADSFGGGLSSSNNLIANNVIYENSIGRVDQGGEALIFCNGTIKNNIFWDNANSTNSVILDSSTPDYCLIENWTGGGEGNITSPPLFVDAANFNFQLLPNSPCIDRGTSITAFIESIAIDGTTITITTDFDGDLRGLDGDGLGKGLTGDGSDMDIGPDEYNPAFFFIRQHILGNQLTDDETSRTLDQNEDDEISIPDLTNSL